MNKKKNVEMEYLVSRERRKEWIGGRCSGHGEGYGKGDHDD